VNRRVMKNIDLACDVRWDEQLASFASKWAKEVNRIFLRNIDLTCDVRWGEQLASFASKWAKMVKRTIMRHIQLWLNVYRYTWMMSSSKGMKREWLIMILEAASRKDLTWPHTDQWEQWKLTAEWIDSLLW
jgi:hypothetical protein